MDRLQGICIGAGYFSQFHFDAWWRLPGVEIVAICDRDLHKAAQAAASFPAAQAYDDLAAALDAHPADFVDIITPPATHLPLVSLAASRVPAIICQKPLAPDLATAQAIVTAARGASCRLMVHENFRFQPWHRELRRLLEVGTIGQHLHTITARTRLGDGFGPDAYLARQPYFRQLPRFLVHETGVHLIDTFRYLGGEITSVYADLRRLNEAIAGEDCGLLHFELAHGGRAIWDANRYNESTAADPRYTFGEFLLEGDRGSLRLAPDGRITIQPLGGPEREHPYTHNSQGFSGDCVYATQQHFIKCLQSGAPFETTAADYLQNLLIVEAAYESARRGRRLQIGDVANSATAPPAGRRIVDLSLPIDEQLPNATVEPFKRLATDGWNATTITLYSHCGTHMDAPRHFLPTGPTLDQQSLATCCGPARVLNLTPVEPRELLTVDRLRPWHDQIGPGERLLLRTDWHHRFGTPDYRNALPRISLELAQWLVSRQVALLGVEPPSVADVNNLEELTAVHRILLGGGVTIVEGLAHLDQLHAPVVELMALPLNIVGGDGCPVRAIAIENLTHDQDL